MKQMKSRRSQRKSRSGSRSKQRSKLNGGSSKCNASDIDPLSQDYFSEIPKQRHIRIRTDLNGRSSQQCQDIRELAKYVRLSEMPMNPMFQNVPFTPEQLRKIRRKERKLEEDENLNRNKENRNSSIFDDNFKPRKGLFMRQ